MRITNASMEVVDHTGRMVDGYDRVDLTASKEDPDTDPAKIGSTDIEMQVRTDLANQATIYREVYDPDQANDIGNEGAWVRTDWFIVHDARLTWLNNRIEVTGYMRGHQGVMREGVSPRTGRRHPSPFDEEDGEPYVRVRWTLW